MTKIYESYRGETAVEIFGESQANFFLKKHGHKENPSDPFTHVVTHQNRSVLVPKSASYEFLDKLSKASDKQAFVAEWIEHAQER